MADVKDRRSTVHASGNKTGSGFRGNLGHGRTDVIPLAPEGFLNLTTQSGTPVTTQGSPVPGLYSANQVNNMSCAQVDSAIAQLNANAAQYAQPQSTYVQWQQSLSNLHARKTSAFCSPPAAAPPPAAPAAAPPAPANQAPIAKAGADQVISQSSTTLDGSSSYDPENSPVTYAWHQLSGPNNSGIINPDKAVTQVTGMMPGSYIFQLTVFDALGSMSSAQVSVTVKQAEVPVSNTGATVLNSGSTTVLTTAPAIIAEPGPFSGGGGGGGGAAPDDSGAPAENQSFLMKGFGWLKHNWWWVLIAAGAVALVAGSGDGKKGDSLTK